MRCSKCNRDFLEKDIHESHDVPCYLFKGINRKEKKAQADKFQRRWLCVDCHNEYEESLRLALIIESEFFSSKYFESEK
jgi:DNA-directed RNA polymerase subunit RPC12/RpoP